MHFTKRQNPESDSVHCPCNYNMLPVHNEGEEEERRLSVCRPRSSPNRKLIIRSTRGIILVTVCSFLCVAEGAKIQLIPRPRKAVAANVAVVTENKFASVAQVQEPKEALTLEDSSLKQLSGGADMLSVPLQAMLVKNEQGEHVLQLSVESSKALQSAMEPPSTQATLPGEAPPAMMAVVDTPIEKLASPTVPVEPFTQTLDPPPAQASHPQDQLVIFSTVATMALLVGALSARRLRSRQLLNFCIENEALEDDLAYDAAYTTRSTIGAASSFYGGYDTFSNAGSDFQSRYNSDLRWRGDLEKFDV